MMKFLFIPWTAAAFVTSGASQHRRSLVTRSFMPGPALPVTDMIHHHEAVLLIPWNNGPLNVNTNLKYNGNDSNNMMHFIREWLVPSANAATPTPPSPSEVQLLREAMAAFFGVDRDFEKAQQLLTKAIEAWQNQPPDERAALYRVRADCSMALLLPQQAEQDYTMAIDLLQGPGGDLADPDELPLATLGRARAIKSQGGGVLTKDRAAFAAKDYQLSLRLSSREDWDTDQEKEEDGASRNPYAAWEWGTCLRQAGSLQQAAQIHALAAQSFDDIGDRARSVIANIDAGIDLAASTDKDSIEEAKTILLKAIKKTTSVEGRDIDLLQRVIAKEGEGRIALASILWDTNDRAAAETQLGDACIRLEQLEADAQARNARLGGLAKNPEPHLSFSIDDGIGAFDISCSKFKNEKFVSETLLWPESLQQKVNKLQNIGK